MDNSEAATLLRYQSVFAAIANGRNLIAAQVLRSLAAEQLNELSVICADVRTMVEADQRRRVDDRRKHGR